MYLKRNALRILNATMVLLLCCMLISVSDAFAMTLNDLAPDRRIDWRQAGYPGQIPTAFDNVINVKDNGVKGDGITDDTGAIQTVINSAPNPTVLYFPAGVYRITAALNLKSGIVLRGAGTLSTRFDVQSSSGGIKISGGTNGSNTPLPADWPKAPPRSLLAMHPAFKWVRAGKFDRKILTPSTPAGNGPKADGCPPTWSARWSKSRLSTATP